MYLSSGTMYRLYDLCVSESSVFRIEGNPIMGSIQLLFLTLFTANLNTFYPFEQHSEHAVCPLKQGAFPSSAGQEAGKDLT